MRRIRRDATKVWHNPELQTFARSRSHDGAARATATHGTSTDARDTKQNRAALEALFSPKKEPEPDKGQRKPAREGPASSKTPGRIVLATPAQVDPQMAERQKLLSKLLLAESRPKIAKAATDFLRAGFSFPEEQDVCLQLLEHTDETQVRSAIDVLGALFANELPKRRAVLASRLRRIEQFAEDQDTRVAAERLRRRVTGRPDLPSAPSEASG